MVIGQFNDRLALPANTSDKVQVSGPFKPDPEDESAEVLFLVVQGEGNDAITVQGHGKWTRDHEKEENDWIGEVNREGKLPDGGRRNLSTGRSRGIGLAIVVKDGKVSNGQFIPPSLQALTWCADFAFV